MKLHHHQSLKSQRAVIEVNSEEYLVDHIFISIFKYEHIKWAAYQ
jgi:hypothetical protein